MRDWNKPKSKAPALNDNWRPRSKRRPKLFGITISYGPTFRGDTMSWKQWYSNERARTQAIVAISKHPTFGSAKYSAVPIEEPV